MEKIGLFVLLSLLLVITSQCKNFPYNRYPIYIENQSLSDICLYVAWGGLGGISYPDTILSFKNELIIKSIKSGQTYKDYYGGSLDDMLFSLPKDTLSIYIFSKDTLDIYPWTIIQNEYKVLKRYDLSIEDIHILYNRYGIPIVTYPPIEVMKDMKMYPPYGSD